MIRVSDLSFGFPKKDLYDKVSFTLEEGQHVAFIGTVGSGKSTLIDMIMDLDKYMYDGLIEIEHVRRFAYISQFPKLDKPEETTVFNYIAEEFIELEEKIADICKEMETSTEIETLLEQYQDAVDQFNALDGDNYANNINKKLGLANLVKQKNLMISELSGGEFKLVQVIREMLHSPELLVMDEPDVFLDFENLNALRTLINTHKKLLVVITHNRYLLNHCFDKIIHLEDTRINEFEGGYIEYNFKLLQTKIELQEQALADEEEMARNQILIDRLRESASAHAEASKGRSLKARVKIQERLEESRTLAPFVDIQQPKIFLETDQIIEDSIALDVSEYGISFDEMLLENVNFEIGSTDKVAIIGSNGTGKTTLLRNLFKNNNEAINVHDGVELAYLSQVQGEVLKVYNTIYQEFFDAGFNTYTEIKDYLRGYGFEEDVLTQKVGDLSGGERNILQIARIAASNANLLLLDEPTSHLDTYAQQALEKAINNFKGAIVMVSHDYYSIINSMDYVLLIENNTIRKMKMKKFKRMIYANHFKRDYLEIEQKKQAVETRIAHALKGNNFEFARELSVELEGYVKLL
jgi:ATP-binding cassette subfamily F protein 3